MNFSPANVLAWSFALLLHGAVVAAFLIDWGEPAPIEIESDRPYFIPAQMVAENPHTAREQKENDRQKSRQDAIRQQRADKEKALLQQKALDDKARIDRDKQLEVQKELDRLTQLKAQQKAQELQKQEDARKDLKAKELAEQDLALAGDELQNLVNAELDAIAAVTDDERALAYVGQIQADIIQNWSRPPSARNGMQALLQVFLVPTGEVVDVSIITSSGNDSFDRSAIQAVRKVKRFEVPKDSTLFEDKFREFEVLFRPEDLRL